MNAAFADLVWLQWLLPGCTYHRTSAPAREHQGAGQKLVSREHRDADDPPLSGGGAMDGTVRGWAATVTMQLKPGTTPAEISDASARAARNMSEPAC